MPRGLVSETISAVGECHARRRRHAHVFIPAHDLCESQPYLSLLPFGQESHH
jgi:hypothetical protein